MIVLLCKDCVATIKDDTATCWVCAAALKVENSKLKAEVERLKKEADDRYHQDGCPGAKPFSRLVWTFHMGGGPYIDLSVMPKMPVIYPVYEEKV